LIGVATFPLIVGSGIGAATGCVISSVVAQIPVLKNVAPLNEGIAGVGCDPKRLRGDGAGFSAIVSAFTSGEAFSAASFRAASAYNLAKFGDAEMSGGAAVEIDVDTSGTVEDCVATTGIAIELVGGTVEIGVGATDTEAVGEISIGVAEVLGRVFIDKTENRGAATGVPADAVLVLVLLERVSTAVATL